MRCLWCVYSCELSAATEDVLTQELEACQQLHELEPDNKCESLLQLAQYKRVMYATLNMCDHLSIDFHG